MAESSVEGLVSACRQVFECWHDRGIVAAYLYGSALGPRHRSDSDVDVAVLDVPHDRLSWADQSKLMDELERATGQPVDLRMLRGCLLPHQVHILKHGQPIWIASSSEADKYARLIQVTYEGEREHRWQVWSSILRTFAARMRSSDESRLSR